MTDNEDDDDNENDNRQFMIAQALQHSANEPKSRHTCIDTYMHAYIHIHTHVYQHIYITGSKRLL